MVNLKEQVGIKAAEFVKDGMIVGLGTGSTAYYFVAELGRRIKEEGLKITAVTTSSVTYDQAESLGIPLKAIDDVEVVDVTVDGADEVDPQLNGIKGGGGALLMEKIVATNSKDCIWMNPSKSKLLGPSNFQWRLCSTGLKIFSVTLNKKVTTLLSVLRKITVLSLTKAILSLTWILK